jgi:hypothetical protein
MSFFKVALFVVCCFHRKDFLGREEIPWGRYFAVELGTDARRRRRSACVHSLWDPEKWPKGLARETEKFDLCRWLPPEVISRRPWCSRFEAKRRPDDGSQTARALEEWNSTRIAVTATSGAKERVLASLRRVGEIPPGPDRRQTRF